MPKSLDFERPVAELEGKIEELRHLSDDGEINIADEVAKLQAKADRPQFSGYASRVSRCAFPVRDWRRTGRSIAKSADKPRNFPYKLRSKSKLPNEN